MNKMQLFVGLLLGLITAAIGSCLYILTFTNLPFAQSIQTIYAANYLGKVVTLGSILDLILFAFLLKKNKEAMAKGIILAVVLLALVTLFI